MKRTIGVISFGLLCLFSCVLAFNPAHAQTTGGGGADPNPKFNSVDIGAAVANVTGRLTLSETIRQNGTGQNIFLGSLDLRSAVGASLTRNAGSYISFDDVSNTYGFIGRADLASGGGISATGLGVVSGNGRPLSIGVSTGGFGFRVLEFTATTGVPNFYTNFINFEAKSGTTISSALNNPNMGETWCSQSYSGGYRIFIADDTACATVVSGQAYLLQAAQSGHTLDSVTLSAGQGGSDKLTLNGSLLDLTANNGDMNISAGGDIFASASSDVSLVASSGTMLIQANGASQAVEMRSTTASTGIARIGAANVFINDNSNADTAIVLVNSSAVCTQATGCPGGAARTWQDMIGSRAYNTDYTNSTGGEIHVNVSGIGNSGNSQTMLVNSITVGACSQNTSTGNCSISAIVPNGGVYRVNGSSAGATIWAEYRP